MKKVWKEFGKAGKANRGAERPLLPPTAHFNAWLGRTNVFRLLYCAVSIGSLHGLQ